jgi:ribosomal protein S18 acetylase RimI-like enzyme
MKILYTTGSSNESSVLLHLINCDDVFIPSLSSRVDVKSYATRIVEKAQRYEAWSNDELIGLVAVYCNSSDHLCAYITNVSVLPSFAGTGIASKLMQYCKDELSAIGFKSIELEVSCKNKIAIALYKKNGFNIVEKNSTVQKMKINLTEAFK